MVRGYESLLAKREWFNSTTIAVLYQRREQMLKCPRCKKNTLNKNKVMNALSRRDNKTYICSLCGSVEAMFDYQIDAMIKQERAWLSEKEK
jgi:predicted RNA-binding Zn-ribbon protein involved in translation (DUF1610 family)